MLFGHFGEIVALFFIGLLVFGPKKIIEMGGQMGKMLREFREATKGMDWSFLSQSDTRPGNSSLSQLSQLSQTLSRFTSPDEPQPVRTPAAQANTVDAAQPEPQEPRPEVTE